MMKLLSLRLPKLHSAKSIIKCGALGLPQNAYRSIAFTAFRKYSDGNKLATKLQPIDQFEYQYDLNELMGKLNSLTKCDVISTASEVHLNNLQDFLRMQQIKSKDDVQAIVTSLIIAAKLGQNVENIIDKIFENEALTTFLDHSDAHIEQMTADEVVSMLVALKLLKVPLHNPVNRKLTIRVTHLLRGECERTM